MSFLRLKTDPILYYSTNNKAERVAFPDALLNGMASNHGLYTLARKDVPKLSKATIKKMAEQTYAEIAFEVLYPYLRWHISDDEVGRLLQDAYDETIIPTPIQHVRDRLYIMWLTKGPTCSFKDYAARFYARILNYFLKKRGLTRIVLVATSGDTGGAIADALKGMSNAFVVVFYPQGEISAGQRRQMTTLHDNIFAVAVNGDFNVCQQLAKYLMGDKKFAYEISKDEDIFTSANSISLGRQLPQMVYPFYGYSRMGLDGNALMVPVIPSGNFGDIKGTVLAKEEGLPVHPIVCAVNENDVFPEFLRTGEYIVKPTKKSPSSAMRVNHPSGMARLFDLYGGHIYDERDPLTDKVIREGIVFQMPDLAALRHDFRAYSISDEECYGAMQDAYERHGIILEPHGAVGWEAIRKANLHSECPILLYETADPGKFPLDGEKALGIRPEIPAQMQAQELLEERIYVIDAHPDKDEEGNEILSAAQIAQAKELFSSLFKPIFSLATP